MRVGGSDINTYLCMAAALASGLYGIKNKLELQPQSVGDNVRAPSHSRLSSNLGDAATKYVEFSVYFFFFFSPYSTYFISK